MNAGTVLLVIALRAVRRKHIPLILTRTGFLIAIVLLGSCGMKRNIESVGKATDEFHRELGAGAGSAIYDQATDQFRRTMSREMAQLFFSRILRKMGACLNSQSKSFNVNFNNAGTFVSSRYSTQCSNGVLDESFVWSILTGRQGFMSIRPTAHFCYLTENVVYWPLVSLADNFRHCSSTVAAANS